MRGRRGGLYLGALVLGTLGPAKSATAECYWDAGKKEIVCIGSGSGTGGIGPIGPNWHQIPPEFFKHILEEPQVLIRAIRIPEGLDPADKEIIRQALEMKRQDFEAFRGWAETDRMVGTDGVGYRKTLDIYKQGIEQYRLEMKQIR